MSFYERFEGLCKERGLRPQSDEIIEVTGVSSPAITGWKKGSAPKADVLIRIATYFGVSVDYLLGVDVEKVHSMGQVSRTENSESDITEQEKALISAFRSVNDYDKLRIIQAVMNIKDEGDSEGIKVYRAARSSTDTAPTVETMSPEDLRKYQSAKKVTSEEDL